MLCLKAFLISTFIPITFSDHWLHLSPHFVSVFKSNAFTVPRIAACTDQFHCTLLISLSIFLLTWNHDPPLIPIPLCLDAVMSVSVWWQPTVTGLLNSPSHQGLPHASSIKQCHLIFLTTASLGLKMGKKWENGIN